MYTILNKFNKYSEDWIPDNYKNIPLYISTNLNNKFEIRNIPKEKYRITSKKGSSFKD